MDITVLDQYLCCLTFPDDMARELFIVSCEERLSSMGYQLYQPTSESFLVVTVKQFLWVIEHDEVQTASLFAHVVPVGEVESD
ncbi:hypothetical protein ASE31_20810 [Acidovorax sp. Root217]|nr:hypothetical protein ASE31_20810 [Acidovorax sp. Root217]